jgi:hypothetical protein
MTSRPFLTGMKRLDVGQDFWQAGDGAQTNGDARAADWHSVQISASMEKLPLGTHRLESKREIPDQVLL